VDGGIPARLGTAGGSAGDLKRRGAKEAEGEEEEQEQEQEEKQGTWPWFGWAGKTRRREGRLGGRMREQEQEKRRWGRNFGNLFFHSSLLVITRDRSGLLVIFGLRTSSDHE